MANPFLVLAVRNIKIVIEYDGTCYYGWQRQLNGPTIQEILEEKIGIITREDIKVTGSGRTDSGVHAIGQVANFKTKSDILCMGLLKGINSLLPEDIVVKELADVCDDFHARYNAKTKIYLYVIHNSPVRTALGRRYTWDICEPLDIDAMKNAVDVLLGTHDFSSFCGSGDGASSHTRTIKDVSVKANKNRIITVTIEGDGFLRHMVRNIVGTLVDVGKGKIDREEFCRILEAKDRKRAGITAPARGLFLKEVKY